MDWIVDQLVRARAATNNDDGASNRGIHDETRATRVLPPSIDWYPDRTVGGADAGMSPLAAIAMLLFTGAITPGPNNLLVLRAAAERGWHASLAGITAIVGGSVVLLALAVAGIGTLVTAWPGLRSAIGLAGALYLAWLGLVLLRAAPTIHEPRARVGGALALFVFQFLNPKGWLLMLVVAATAPQADIAATLLRLAPLTVAITAACLLLWAALGHALADAFAHPVQRAWIDRACGLALFACALSLLA